MTEQFVYQYITQRIKQLGYNEHFLEYKDLILEPATTVGTETEPSVRIFKSNNGLLFILDDPDSLVVESEYGKYDSLNNVSDNTHEHKGTIEIKNYDTDKKRLKCILAVIVS